VLRDPYALRLSALRFTQALARLVGWKMTLKELALRMRCSRCGLKAAEVVAVAKPRPRGVAMATDPASAPRTTREAPLRMRCSRCEKKAAEVVDVARPRPRGV